MLYSFLRSCLIEDSVKIIKENGQIIYTIDALADKEKKEVKMGILKTELAKYADRGLLSGLGQFFGIVAPGLIMAKHLFVGLKRPLCCDDTMNGDSEKIVYSWIPTYDYEWHEKTSRSQLKQLDAPAKSVFVVIISKNERQHKIHFPDIYGWIERWNWVDSDSYLNAAPINSESRYDKRIY